ncbi:MAG: hypothetical protein KKB37_12450, partial [Alphaproteobacteria bacterium]|nr:hypothetical protein [Alphaproteobacteria bacterium]
MPHVLTAHTLHRSVGFRLLLWFVLVAAEVLIISQLFEYKAHIKAHIPAQYEPIMVLKWLVRCLIVAVAVFLLLNWSRRVELASTWQQSVIRHDLLVPSAVNLALLILLVITGVYYAANAPSVADPPWHLIALFGALLTATSLSLVAVLIPLDRLVAFVWHWRTSAAVAAALGFTVMTLADLTQKLWDMAANATLSFSAAIMRLYEPHVFVDATERSITISDFKVIVSDECSGIEGIALITAFVGMYLLVFRKQLVFPRAYFLFP